MILEVETERLLLRQWQNRDFEDFASFFTEVGNARYVGGACDRPQAWRRMATIIGHWALRGFGFWAVEEKATGRFVGSIGLWRPEGWPELEIGYWVVPEMQGKGYATEASRKSRDVAFNDLGTPTLVSNIHPNNTASKRVAMRLGAHYEETIELLNLGPHCVYRYPSS